MTRPNERGQNPGQNKGQTNPKQSAENAKKEAQNLKQNAQSQASELADQAKQQARGQIEQNRNVASQELDKVAHATRAAASDLSDQDREGLSQYVESLANNMSSLSESMRNKSVDELVREVSGIARQNPALFVAGSLAIGLGISRFAKASSTQQHGESASQRDSGSERAGLSGRESTLGSSQQSSGVSSGTSRTSMYAGYSDAEPESRAGSNWPSGNSASSHTAGDYTDRDTPSTNKGTAATPPTPGQARTPSDSNSTNNRGGKRYE